MVLFVALTLAGMISFMRMEVQGDPDIDFPAVVVSISQPGAAPTEIDTQITEKVESALASMENVETITSTVSEGNSRTFITFEIGNDVNDLVNEAKSNIDQIRGDLPDGIIEPRVFKAQAGQGSFANYAVVADDMTMEQLSWFVDDTVSKRLLAVPGMGSASRSGGVNREIRVILDPARMQSLGVTASQVNSFLRQNNLNAGGGQAEIAGARQSVRVIGNAETAYELGQQRISLGGGRSVKLADIAEVRDGQSEIRSISRVNGQPVVTIDLSRARGKSDVTVYDEAQIVMQQIEDEYPGVEFVELFNTVTYTKGQYDSSIAALVEGAILAVVVVFFFLRDWRATLISAIAIPLSAIPTFFFLDQMGFTLNQMSLLALGLVAGVLVDDAIVEIENIVRHMRMGKTAYQASIDAADEIGLAVAATSFSIVAVFLPVAMMPGVAGQYFQNFGITVVVSVLMSLAVARMITPMLAAYFLKPHGEADHANGPWIQRYSRVLEWTLDRTKARQIKDAKIARKGRIGFFGKLGAHLRGDHRAWVMGFGLLSFVATLVLFFITPMQFFPDADLDFAQVDMSMVPGTTLEQTEARAEEALAILESQPETQNTLMTVSEGNANFFITFRPDRERSSDEFQRAVSSELRQVPDARLNFRNMQGGGGRGRDINVMLSGSNPELLEQTAATLVEQMGSVSELQGPRVEADLQRPELIIEPRADLAASLGVTTASLSQAIRIATIGEIDQNAARFSLEGRQVPIRVMLPESSRDRISTIRNLPVPTAAGASVPLERVADIRFGAGPTSIQREDRQRRVYVSADLSPGAAEGVAKAKVDDLPIMQDLPLGVSNAPSGQDRWLAEFAVNFQIALISGILLVFAVLVLLYRRLMSPLVNMGSLLLAPLGGILAIKLTGLALSLPVFIGMLLLFGIVAKNSILLVDFAIEAMAEGHRKYDAIMEAGRKRAQPIVMTTVAMTAGMIPTAVSLSADGAWRQPMGVAVIGGLILSTFLTLLIVPAGFSLADGIEKRAGPWLRNRFLSYRPGMDDGTIRGQKTGIQPAE